MAAGGAMATAGVVGAGAEPKTTDETADETADRAATPEGLGEALRIGWL